MTFLTPLPRLFLQTAFEIGIFDQFVSFLLTELTVPSRNRIRMYETRGLVGLVGLSQVSQVSNEVSQVSQVSNEVSQVSRVSNEVSQVSQVSKRGLTGLKTRSHRSQNRSATESVGLTGLETSYATFSGPTYPFLYLVLHRIR